MAVPERGDLVWIDFSPQAGSEHRGRRPALVISPKEYHHKTPLTVVCPIASKIKDYPFEVVLPEGLPVQGAILADQVRSLDRNVRKMQTAGHVPPSVIEEVQLKLAALLGMHDILTE